MSFSVPASIPELSGKALIVPVVSTANLAQLAADLLIASLSLRRLAVVDPSYFVPAVGGREDGELGITLPMELYGSPASNVVIVQQRSPVLKSKKQKFVDALLKFISTSGVACVLFLSGLDVTNRTDQQMLTPTYFITPIALDLEKTPLNRLASLPIPRFHNENETIPTIPGSGLTKRILSSLPEGWSIPISALLHFVLEGDNRYDAQLFASVVSRVVGLDQLIWRQPTSWAEGLFGAPPDQDIYG
ncbi:hypothetical protein BDN72DRAFT_797423 [Pluteus cervinus]|uniref:Uncharacterized protein n=1 Tax=Pluteus cervinus TaxID=181527 RepID=A0ACD3AUM9_9AGAR|nr:hypothetical protein BDN72DRAFT_797423 [Pluteus cervinus]